MALLTVSDLLLVTSQQDALNLELSLCAAFGLPTTAWQALSPEIAILATNAQIVSTYSVTINQIAQGGFPSSAATIPAPSAITNDGAGFLTTWMDLCSTSYYNVSRVQASFATGTTTVLNTSAPSTSYPFIAGQLHFQHPITGATYTCTAPGTIAPTGTTTIPIQADGGFPGNAGTAAAGTTLILLTPFSGVAPQALATSLVGTNIETNAALLLRGQGKLASLSPNGAAAAYTFVATSVPTPAARSAATFPFNQLVDSLDNPVTVTAPITRATELLNVATGVVGLYVANAAGSPSAPDIAEIQSAIQALCVPLATTATVAAVGTVSLNLNFNVYVKQSTGLSATQVLANIDAAIQLFCQNTPIGGYTTPVQTNYIPIDLLEEVITDANPGTVDLQMLNPTGNLAVGATSVPVPGTRTATAANVFFV